MSFHTADFQHLSKFNSAVSCHFISDYENYVKSKIELEKSEPKSQMFAPSSIRCKRISWFRLRGVQPDVNKDPDLTLNFTADIGTSCHRIIQENLINLYKDSWIPVADYLSKVCPDYEYKLEEVGFETQVEIQNPPVRFSCDGILFLDNKYYLLEIKTASYSSFDQLTGPKPEHMDQIRCYSTLLRLPNVLVLYVDRQYGSLKCFEISVSLEDMENVNAMFRDVQNSVKSMIAPPKLPANDPWCTPSHCLYYRKCQEW